MNKIFENEYTMETKYYKEYVYSVLCKNTIILGIITAILGILLFMLLDETISYIMLTSAIIAGITSIIMPIITIRQLEETGKRLNNGKIEKTNIKFLKNIVMEEGKVRLEFEYNQIKKIVETKNFIVLKISNYSSILVLKNGFIKGKEQDFIKFMKTRIIDSN